MFIFLTKWKFIPYKQGAGGVWNDVPQLLSLNLRVDTYKHTSYFTLFLSVWIDITKKNHRVHVETRANTNFLSCEVFTVWFTLELFDFSTGLFVGEWKSTFHPRMSWNFVRLGYLRLEYNRVYDWYKRRE